MSNSLTVCLLLVLAIIAFNEFRTAQADPIMEYRAHLNEDGSIVLAHDHLMKRITRQGVHGEGPGMEWGSGGGCACGGGCCDCNCGCGCYCCGK